MPALLLNLLKAWWPQIAAIAGAFLLGFIVAWQLQGVRLDAAANDMQQMQLEFDSWRQSLREQETTLAAQRESLRQKELADYRRMQDELEKQIVAGDAYRRCVAAGKCGARVQYVQTGSACPAVGVSAAGGTDAAGPDPVPATGDPAAPAVVADCARTTLQLNRLQEGIAGQTGYGEAP